MNSSTPTIQSDLTCPVCKAPLSQGRDQEAEANSLAAIDIYSVPKPREES
ncbi:MAG TPA: hypothetical protein VGE07_29430 [Herpetosiphonaceae bacterium]